MSTTPEEQARIKAEEQGGGAKSTHPVWVRCDGEEGANCYDARDAAHAIEVARKDFGYGPEDPDALEYLFAQPVTADEVDGLRDEIATLRAENGDLCALLAQIASNLDAAGIPPDDDLGRRAKRAIGDLADGHNLLDAANVPDHPDLGHRVTLLIEHDRDATADLRATEDRMQADLDAANTTIARLANRITGELATELKQLRAERDLLTRQLTAETFGAESVVGPGGEVWTQVPIGGPAWQRGDAYVCRFARGWGLRRRGAAPQFHPTAWAAMEAATKAAKEEG